MRNLYLLSILSIILIFGCTTKKDTNTEKIEIAKEIVQVQIDSTLITRKVDSVVLQIDRFKDLIKEMQTDGYYMVMYKNWWHGYKNNANKIKVNPTDSFVILNSNRAFSCTKNLSTNRRESFDSVYFRNAIITEIIMNKQQSGERKYGDIKVIQFVFPTSLEAQKAIPNFKRMSYYTISTNFLKNPNHFFVFENAIYFSRVRAAALDVFVFKKQFEKMYGEQKALRW